VAKSGYNRSRLNHARGSRGVEQAVEFLDLLERGRNGDQEALTVLVQQYEREVRVTARVLLGPALRPHLDSLDLVQSVHRSLLVGLHGGRFEFNSPKDLVALALTMVRRKVARQWRHLQRQKRLESSSASQNLPRRPYLTVFVQRRPGSRGPVQRPGPGIVPAPERGGIHHPANAFGGVSYSRDRRASRPERRRPARSANPAPPPPSGLRRSRRLVVEPNRLSDRKSGRAKEEKGLLRCDE
jgi:hypothetical protein